jgi:hypothetical protein
VNLDFLEREWSIVAAAPVLAFALFFGGAVLGWLVHGLFHKQSMHVTRERREMAEEKAAKLERGINDELSARRDAPDQPFGDMEQIRITKPRPQEVLSDPVKATDGATSYSVEGTLRRLPPGHEIWLLVQDEKAQHVRPQGWNVVKHDPETGRWTGRVYARGDVRVIAVVAPPTSQQLFRYYQSVGEKLRDQFEPLDKVPPECTNQHSVQTKLPALQA